MHSVLGTPIPSYTYKYTEGRLRCIVQNAELIDVSRQAEVRRKNNTGVTDQQCRHPDLHEENKARGRLFHNSTNHTDII